MRVFKALALLLALTLPTSAAFIPTDGPVGPEGQRSAIDLPAELHLRNTGGSDGYGLCVFSAFEDACMWQGYPQMKGFKTWMEQFPGGGWPEKLDKYVKLFCEEKGVEVPPYIQHVGGDEALLELAIKTRRAPCITYAGMDDFYSSDIAHMVVLSDFTKTYASILDNNRPGKWVWMSREDLSFRWHLNTIDKGWAVILLGPPPPPSEEGVDPVPPKPKPTPKPKPRRPLLPWKKVVFHDGETVYKLYDAEGKFLGVWDERGWHKAVGPDSWETRTDGEPPVAPPEDKGIQAVSWYTDYSAAVEAEAKSGKPLFILFSSASCGACKKLEASTLSDPAVMAKLNALFTPLLLKDTDPAFLRAFGIQFYPTMAVVKTGVEKDRLVGAVGSEELLKFLQKNSNKGVDQYFRDMNPISRDEAYGLIDDSDKWFVTLVVEDLKKRAEVLSWVKSDPRLVEAAKVHLNVYTRDFWASGRMKKSVTVQRPFGVDNRAVWTADTVTKDVIFEALVVAGVAKAPEPKRPDPAPAPKPVEPKSPESPSPVNVPTTIPLWLFWSGIGGAGFVVYYLSQKR